MSDIDAAVIDRIAQAIDALMQNRRVIPLSVDLWDVDLIAQYIKRTHEQTRIHVVSLPGFPQPIVLPSERANRSRALWKAAEVIAWAEAHQSGVGAIGRPRKRDKRDD